MSNRSRINLVFITCRMKMMLISMGFEIVRIIKLRIHMKYAAAVLILIINFCTGYGQDIRDTLNVVTKTKVVLTDAKKMELEPIIDVPQTPAPTFTYNLKPKQL